MKTVSLLWVKGLLQAAALQGLTESEVLEKSGVDSLETLSTTRISLEDTLSIWRSIEQLSGDPLFGFHMGLSLKPTHFQLVAFTMLSSPTLGEAIEKVLKYQRLISDGGDFSLVKLNDHETELVYRPTADNFSYHQIDAVLVIVLSFARWLLGREISPEAVLFNHGKEAGLSEYQDYFACRIEFNQPQNSIIFPASLLQERLSGYDPQLATMHQNMADVQLQHLAKPEIIMRLQQQLALSSEPVNRDRLAEKMGMSGRSLQRKLQAHGSNFQQVYDEFRHEKSLLLLQDLSLSLVEVSDQLGFSESSTFYRAFKRWQGITPGEYRISVSDEASKTNADT